MKHSVGRCQSKLRCVVQGRSLASADENPFRYFNSSPEVIRLAVMMYIRYPLSLRQVEDLLFEFAKRAGLGVFEVIPVHTPQSQQPGPRVQYYRSSRRSNAAVETGPLPLGPWCVIRAALSKTKLLSRSTSLTPSAIVNKHIPTCAGPALGGAPIN